MRTNQLWGFEYCRNTAFRDMTYALHKNNITAVFNSLPHEFQVGKSLDWEAADELMSDRGMRHYILSSNVVNLSQKIAINEKHDFKWMTNIPDSKKQYNFGATFIRFLKYENKMEIFISTNPDHEKDNLSWLVSIDIEKDTYACANQTPDTKVAIDLAFQIITFVELSEIQEKKILPKGKIGKTKSDKIVNDESFMVIYADSHWATTIFVKNNFPVKGHFLLQPFGLNGAQRKLIFIHPFEKKGYTLRAGKLREEQI